LNDEEILEAVSRQLNHTAKNMGYRALTASVREETGENVSSVKVMEAVRELDPDGVARRRKQKHLRINYATMGPNQTWHFDGWDKTASAGFAISGCIDGFSRKVSPPYLLCLFAKL
jgi:hypothetical protein